MVGNKKSWYKRWWAITIFIIIGVAILGSFLPDHEIQNNSTTFANLSENNLKPISQEKDNSTLFQEQTPQPITPKTPSQNTNIKVTRIIDGDTLEISTGDKVRLICIDTPEKNEAGYQEASNYLRNLVLNKEVKLEKDTSETDRYGRLLRYVYINETFVNELIVKHGYGKTYLYAPDTKLCPIIKTAESYAIANSLGIWAKKETQTSTTQPSNCQCETDLDCADFSTHNSAQACYDYCFEVKGYDFHKLDGKDNDGLVCESLK